jgi:hypothetical protein
MSINVNELENASSFPRIFNLGRDVYGKSRKLGFTLNTADTAVPASSTIKLATPPKGAKLVGGRVLFGAMGGTASVQIGIAGTVGKFLGGTACASAGASDFANTLALGYGTVFDGATTIIATTNDVAFANDKDFVGHIEVVVE